MQTLLWTTVSIFCSLLVIHYLNIFCTLDSKAVCRYVSALASAFAELSPRLGGVTAAAVLHLYMLKGVLHSPNHFFDTTPTGRILSRFSKDTYTVDEKLSFAMGDIVYFTVQVEQLDQFSFLLCFTLHGDTDISLRFRIAQAFFGGKHLRRRGSQALLGEGQIFSSGFCLLCFFFLFQVSNTLSLSTDSKVAFVSSKNIFLRMEG